MKRKKLIYIVGALIILVVVGFVFKPQSAPKNEVNLETAKVGRGDINEVITATGTLEALETVEVGTQVSGVIDKLYVDFNSKVKKGDILAKIDQTPLLASLEQSAASVENAQAELDYQEANFNRTKVLFDKKLIAQSDYDLAVYNYDKAKASLKSAQSSHNRNKINLAYATIYSPIDGIVLDRAVDEGQTVAASFNTPKLFTIVKDLKQMRVEASIDEADIGKVKVGQRVEFNVDAYPEKTFNGKVSQIRLQPVQTSNVVTYTVIIDAPNPDQNLMPGMTANVTFYVTERKNVVTVSAKAVNLIATPDSWKSLKKSNPELTIEMPGQHKMGNGEQFKGRQQMTGSDSTQKRNFDGGSRNFGKRGEGFKMPDNMKIVWVKNGNTIKPQRVILGETDEISYEVIKGLNEGDEVVTSLGKPASYGGMTQSNVQRSPFMPTRPGRNRR